MENNCKCGKHDKAKVSVVIPLYNGAKHIDKCLSSQFSQTYQCIEIICVNDGSSDNSLEILNSYSDRIVLIDKPVNQGAWRARETGIENATGEYICFCDIDDFVEPNWIETLVRQLEKTGSDISVCGFRRISSATGKTLSVEMTKFGETCYDLTEDIFVLLSVNYSLWNKLYKKELMENLVKFKDDPTISDDLLLNVSIYPKVKKISFSPEVCYNYYIYEGFTNNSVSDERYGLLKDRLLEVKELYNNLNLHYDWHEYLSLTVFTLFAVFIPVKLGESKGNTLHPYVRDVRKYMNEHFPLWRKPKVFSQRSRGKSNKQGKKTGLSKLYISWVIVKLGLTVPFVRVYNFILRTLSIEIKW